MTNYKVTYFETTGLAELIRFILVHAGQTFEDRRVSLSEWREFQKTLPWERLPIVEIDGQEYHQSLAISRFLAKRFKLAGDNDKENLEIDAIVDTINDMRIHFSDCLWEQNALEKRKKGQILFDRVVPFYLPKFEAMVKNGGYLWKNKLTWADLMFVSLLPYLNISYHADVLEYYSDLQEYAAKISNLPNIREWLRQRPTTCCLRQLVLQSKDHVLHKCQ